MRSNAVVMHAPGRLAVESLALDPPGPADAVVDVDWCGVSAGTERLFWSGEMPPFPGMGYPLVPGYEAVGRVVEAGPEAGVKAGDAVFAPGARCYGDVRGLFGGAASQLVSAGARLRRIDPGLGADGALLALAATAHHALLGSPAAAPRLIVGHGALGRLLARISLALDLAPPTVWENAATRRAGALGYPVLDPEADPRRDYAQIFDASGDAAALDALIGRLAKGGELVLAGFYSQRLSFDFAPAFMREARLRIAAEWAAEDLTAVLRLVDAGRLSLGGLVTHTAPAAEAEGAYAAAFNDRSCLKMVLDWRNAA